jgi:uncharacterized membrane protein YhiD involved in acid resistance
MTYSGMSYSRGLVQSLALGGILSTMIMLAIGNDIARGLGLMGALSVVRFRATLKDPKDLLFVFASQGLGVACGVQAYMVAVMGALVFSVAAVYASWSSFGSKHQFDAILRVTVPTLQRKVDEFNAVLANHCASHALLNLRDLGPETQEHSYHIKFFDADDKGLLVTDLYKIEGISGVTLLMQDQLIEV